MEQENDNIHNKEYKQIDSANEQYTYYIYLMIQQVIQLHHLALHQSYLLWITIIQTS